jgi:hypothetical protein
VSRTRSIGQAIAGVGVARIDRQRAAKALRRQLVLFIKLLIRHAEIEISSRIRWRYVHGALVRSNGLGHPALVLQHGTEIVVSIRIIGRDFKGLVVRANGLVQTAFGLQQGSQVVPATGHLRADS